MKKNSDDGKPQITIAAPGVNYRPQEAKIGALELLSPQEPRTQGGDPLTIIEE